MIVVAREIVMVVVRHRVATTGVEHERVLDLGNIAAGYLQRVFAGRDVSAVEGGVVWGRAQRM